MAKILLLNGPNLNLLGEREPQYYGHERLVDIEKHLQERARALGHALVVYQSNHEGDLMDKLQQARHEGVDFLVFNPGGYTHTSVALRDAVVAAGLPFIEVHISNIYAREAFRQHSYFSDLALGTITGLGSQGYEHALLSADRYLQTHKT